jgi:hypothetical protein
LHELSAESSAVTTFSRLLPSAGIFPVAHDATASIALCARAALQDPLSAARIPARVKAFAGSLVARHPEFLR